MESVMLHITPGTAGTLTVCLSVSSMYPIVASCVALMSLKLPYTNPRMPLTISTIVTILTAFTYCLHCKEFLDSHTQRSDYLPFLLRQGQPLSGAYQPLTFSFFNRKPPL